MGKSIKGNKKWKVKGTYKLPWRPKLEVEVYIYPLPLALDAGSCLEPRAGRFTLGKETPYPLNRRLSGPQGLSGRARKTLPPQQFDLQIVQPVASRYTDYAIPAHGIKTEFSLPGNKGHKKTNTCHFNRNKRCHKLVTHTHYNTRVQTLISLT